MLARCSGPRGRIVFRTGVPAAVAVAAAGRRRRRCAGDLAAAAT